MPHGCCYLWNPNLIRLHVISDGLITLAYYSIPLTLLYFVRRRKDLAFDWMFLCFAVFIVACGTTHLMEILNIWTPTYWLSGLIKAITALTSVVTAVLLVRLVPKALALPSPAQLRVANESLRQEVEERTAAGKRIEALNEKLSSQASQLEEANRELESFGYSVSHDLRAPLRHIDGYIELLRQDSPVLDDSQKHYMKVITESAHQMGLLIDNLLAFSRMGRVDLHQGWTDTEAMVREVSNGFSMETKGREIEWKIGALPKVCVDPVLFRQVWTNLLSNAVKYSSRRPRSEITITGRELASEFIFSVQDNGSGFDMRHVDKLFGIFQRLHQADEFEGTGIGLANVRRIIARHGGRTWAEGKVNVGATFYFTLPKTTPAEAPLSDV
jgi:signal transduction histidine kinase